MQNIRRDARPGVSFVFAAVMAVAAVIAPLSWVSADDSPGAALRLGDLVDLDAFERRVRMAGDLIAKRDRKRTWKKGFMGIRDFQYPPLTVKEAREFFDAFTMAGLMLAVIEVTSGDANG